MEGKNIIYFYRDWWDFLEDFTIEQRGEWITYVMQYVNDLKPELPKDKQVMSVCKITQNQLKRDLQDWLKSIEKKSEAGKKGMASRWGNKNNNTNDNNDNNVITGNNIVITGDNDKDIVKDKVIVKDIDKDIYNQKEEDNIEALKTLILELEMFLGRNLTNAESETIKDFSNTMTPDSILRDIKFYSGKSKTPISYMKTCIENAKIQKQLKPIEEDKPSGSAWLDNFEKKVWDGGKHD